MNKKEIEKAQLFDVFASYIDRKVIPNLVSSGLMPTDDNKVMAVLKRYNKIKVFVEVDSEANVSVRRGKGEFHLRRDKAQACGYRLFEGDVSDARIVTMLAHLNSGTEGELKFKDSAVFLKEEAQENNDRKLKSTRKANKKLLKRRAKALDGVGEKVKEVSKILNLSSARLTLDEDGRLLRTAKAEIRGHDGVVTYVEVEPNSDFLITRFGRSISVTAGAGGDFEIAAKGNMSGATQLEMLEAVSGGNTNSEISTRELAFKYAAQKMEPLKAASPEGNHVIIFSRDEVSDAAQNAFNALDIDPL